MMRESGIYAELQRIVLNPDSIPEYDLKITTFSNDSDDIDINQLLAHFYLLSVFSLLSLLILLIEIIDWKTFNCKILNMISKFCNYLTVVF